MGDLGEGGVAARVVLPTGVAVLFRFGIGQCCRGSVVLFELDATVVVL